MTEDAPVQFSVTRIGDDTFRLVSQSATRIVFTGIIERKKIAAFIEGEIERLDVIPWQVDSAPEL